VAVQTVEGKFSALDGGKVWPIIFKCRARVREIHTHALTSQAVAQTAAVRRHRALLQNLAQHLANEVYIYDDIPDLQIFIQATNLTDKERISSAKGNTAFIRIFNPTRCAEKHRFPSRNEYFKYTFGCKYEQRAAAAEKRPRALVSCLLY